MYDITRPLTEDTPVYDGHEEFRIKKTRSIDPDGYNLSHFSMGAHCGSHLDAPAHFIDGGATVNDFPEDLKVVRCLLFTAGSMTIEDLPRGTPAMIIRSSAGFPGISEADAKQLIEKGVRLVGTDLLSIAPGDCEAPVHRALLSANVWIMENLDLSEPKDGLYELICLPLRIVGAEGAPVRALLRR